MLMPECDHTLAGGCDDHLTFCLRCGHWFAAFVDDDGFLAWRPFDRDPMPV